MIRKQIILLPILLAIHFSSVAYAEDQNSFILPIKNNPVIANSESISRLRGGGDDIFNNQGYAFWQMGEECPGKRLKGLDMKGNNWVLNIGKKGLGFWKEKPRILERIA